MKTKIKPIASLTLVLACFGFLACGPQDSELGERPDPIVLGGKADIPWWIKPQTANFDCNQPVKSAFKGTNSAHMYSFAGQKGQPVTFVFKATYPAWKGAALAVFDSETGKRVAFKRNPWKNHVELPFVAEKDSKYQVAVYSIWWFTTGDYVLTAKCDQGIARPKKLWGIDSNYVIAYEEAGGTWTVDGEQSDPLAIMKDRGAQAYRLRIWVDNHPGNGEPGTLENDAIEMAKRAQAKGLYVIPTLFMSRGWGADNAQEAPLDWADLTVEKRAEEAKKWAQSAVEQLLANGIKTKTYGIGNETDYGFCGVFKITDDLDYLRTNIWPDAATLMKATIEGVKAAAGTADLEFMLHISRGYDTELAMAFFQTMQEQGVEFSMAGLSYYPNPWGQLKYEQFDVTVNRLFDELGLKTVIPEYAYAASDAWVGWNYQVDSYTLSEQGQADFVRDLKTRVFTNEKIEGAFYWTPEEALTAADWSVNSLFEPNIFRKSPRARLALDEL